LLRLLAASQVIYLHAVVFLDIEGRGYLSVLHYIAAIFPGVPIFFVISGFLVSQSYENSRNVRRYARKRALRIFPALWVCFVVTIILLGAFVTLERFTSLNVTLAGEAFLRSWSFPIWTVSQLTVGQFFSPAALAGFGVGNTNPSLWTIPIEIGFYFLVPLMYSLIITRWRQAASSAVLVGVALLSFLVWYLGPFISFGVAVGRDELTADVPTMPTAASILTQTPLPHLYWFISGVLLWRHFGIIGRFVRDRVLLWSSCYALLAYAPVWFEAEWMRATFGYQLARAVGLAMWSLSFAMSFRGASHRLLRGLDLSYGLYLFHMLIINSLVELELGGESAWILLVYAVSAVLALLSWKLVEEPVLARKNLSPRASRGVLT
jgi:peptidoglycan/LPS O-acetylase OafA/YrhL